MVGREHAADVVGFVFKGDQHIADVALGEGGGGGTAAVFIHGHVSQKLAGEIVGACFIAIIGFERVAVGAEKGIAAVAGGFRVGNHDFQVFFGEICPVAHLLGVAFAHEKHGGAGEGHGVIGQAFGPVLCHQAFIGQQFDVGELVHGDHIGLQAVGHGQRLLAGAAVGLLDFNAAAGMFGGIFFFKQGVVIFIEIACHIVRYIEQLHGLPVCGGRGGRGGGMFIGLRRAGG